MIKPFLLEFSQNVAVESTTFLLRVPEVLVSVFTSSFHLTEKGPFLHYNALPRIYRYLRHCGTILRSIEKVQSVGQKAHSAVLKYGEFVTSLVF